MKNGNNMEKNNHISQRTKSIGIELLNDGFVIIATPKQYEEILRKTNYERGNYNGE